ncbi:MAG: methyltransferase domain-containing protein [Solirubrobacteraceae bacterium]
MPAEHHPPEFRFEHVDAVNDLYNPAAGSGRYLLAAAAAAADASVDLVTSHSLFTHLLADDLVNYVQKSARVLRAQGRMAMTVFCLEHIQRFPEFGRRWTFRNRIGDARVGNPRHAEAAAAYEEAYLVETARRAGVAGAEIRPYGHQAWIIAVR